MKNKSTMKDCTIQLTKEEPRLLDLLSAWWRNSTLFRLSWIWKLGSLCMKSLISS